MFSFHFDGTLVKTFIKLFIVTDNYFTMYFLYIFVFRKSLIFKPGQNKHLIVFFFLYAVLVIFLSRYFWQSSLLDKRIFICKIYLLWDNHQLLVYYLLLDYFQFHRKENISTWIFIMTLHDFLLLCFLQ